MRTYMILIVALIACACNERIGIAPQLTNDDNWAPEVTLGHNNYQRVQLNLSQPPDLQIYRNLARLIIQAGKNNQPLVPIDTVALPYNGPFRFKALNQYISPPVFEPNTRYDLFVSVQYHNGTTRTAGGLSFFTPVVKGRVLQHVSPPPGLIYGLRGFLNAFGFGGNQLYIVSYDNLYRLDPVTGATTLLLANFTPGDDRHGFYYFDMAVHDSVAFFAEHPRHEPQTIILARLHLGTLEMSRDLRLNLPNGANAGRVLCHNGEELYVLWRFADGQQIVRLDARNGGVLELFPKYTSELLLHDYDCVAIVDGELWITRNAFSNSFISFDNRLSRFDPRGQLLGAEQRNPVFSTSGLAWDGLHFWVFDRENNAFVKIELDGL